MPDGSEDTSLKDITLSVGWIMMLILLGTIDIIELLAVVFNLTGYWIIIILAINIFAILLVLVWRIISEGFSFSAIFGTWKNLLVLLIDQIPVVGDFFPGLILFMLGIRKMPFKGKSGQAKPPELP